MSSFTKQLRKVPSRLFNRMRGRRRGSGVGDGAVSLSRKAADTLSTSATAVGGDDEILSEQERRILMELLNKNINMDFILEMKEAFKLFDKNGDGFINGKELGFMLRSLGRNPTEEEVFNLMAEVDVDHNGKLDFSEFTVMMKDKMTEEDLELQIKQSLRVFDSNGDGYISRAEFKQCMMHFTDEELTDKEVDNMLSQADLNNDGKIDYNEFSKMILEGMGVEDARAIRKESLSPKKK